MHRGSCVRQTCGVMLLCFQLAACGGGGGSGSNQPTPTPRPTPAAETALEAVGGVAQSAVVGVAVIVAQIPIPTPVAGAALAPRAERLPASSAAAGTVLASVTEALRSTGDGGAAVLGNCPRGGTVDATCTEQGGSTTVSSSFSSCAIAGPSPSDTITSSGGLTTTVASIGVCRTGALPRNVRITTRFNNFTGTLRAGNGTLIERVSGSFTQTIDPSGQGCAGADGTLTTDGSLNAQQPSIGIDVALVARGLSFALGSSGGAPCTRTVTASGGMDVDDRATGRRFSTNLRGLEMTLTKEQNDAVAATLDGSMAVNCLGDIDLQTPSPLMIPNGTDCPTAGLLALMRADGIDGQVGFTAEGGFDIDLDADGLPEKEVSSCHQSSQCK